MARKRLSDLLREEANKSPAEPDSPSTGPDPSEETPVTQDAAKGTASTEAKPKAKSIERTGSPKTSEQDSLNGATVESAAAGTTASPPAADETPASHRRHGPTKAELEATIAELQVTLYQTQEAAQRQEAALQQQVTHLKAELESQQTLIEQLQTDVQQVQSLKAQLEEARKVILQLSQANAQPAPPLPSKPLPPQPVMAVQAAEPELEVAQPARPAAASSPRPAPPAPPKHQIALRQVLAHPTQPGSLPKMSSEESKLSETDMGWVD